MTMHQVVYFSNVSENTKRFVEKLDVDALVADLSAHLINLSLDSTNKKLFLGD